MRHTYRWPIRCRGCDARLHFDRGQWRAASWPLLAVNLTVVLVAVLMRYFGRQLLGQNMVDLWIVRYVSEVILALVFARWIWFVHRQLNLVIEERSGRTG